MSIAFVAAGSIATGVSPINPTFGATPTAGNLVVCVYASITNTSPTLTGVSGWSTLDLDPRIVMFYKPNCASGETAPTVNNLGTSDLNAMLLEFSGVKTTSPLDDSGWDAQFTSPATATAAAPDTFSSGALVISTLHNDLTKAGTATTTHTYNNGASAVTPSGGENDATSTLYHFRFAYGFTNSNDNADSVEVASSSMNVNSIRGIIASFIDATGSNRIPHRNPIFQLLAQ